MVLAHSLTHSPSWKCCHTRNSAEKRIGIWTLLLILMTICEKHFWKRASIKNAQRQFHWTRHRQASIRSTVLMEPTEGIWRDVGYSIQRHKHKHNLAEFIDLTEECHGRIVIGCQKHWKREAIQDQWNVTLQCLAYHSRMLFSLIAIMTSSLTS